MRTPIEIYILPIISQARDITPKRISFSKDDPTSVVLIYDGECNPRLSIPEMMWINSNGDTIVKARVPSSLLEDFRLIINGKYSKVSKHTKGLILAFNSDNQEAFRRADAVLNKKPYLRDNIQNRLRITDLDSIVDEYESLIYENNLINDEEIIGITVQSG